MVPDLLRAAADVIDTGWTRCKDIDPDTGAVCANGALRVAVGHTTITDALTGRVRLDVSMETSYEDAKKMGQQIAAAHNALSEYLATEHGYELNTPLLPSIIRYNDNIAQSGSEVAGIMRATAMWVESHPENELRAVEAAARSAIVYMPPLPPVYSNPVGASV